jgi:hypothetical protein
MGAVENAIEACGMAAKVTEIVSGGSGGVDRLGERYARQRDLPCKIFPAQCNTEKAPGRFGTWKWLSTRTMASRYGTGQAKAQPI